MNFPESSAYDEADDLSNYIKAGTLETLERKKMIPFKILGKPVAVFWDEGGEHYALEMSCKHQAAPLTAGKFTSGVVTCQRHGWQYDLKSGSCLKPADSPGLRRHQVRMRDGQVYVSFHAIAR